MTVSVAVILVREAINETDVELVELMSAWNKAKEGSFQTFDNRGGGRAV